MQQWSFGPNPHRTPTRNASKWHLLMWMGVFTLHASNIKGKTFRFACVSHRASCVDWPYFRSKKSCLLEIGKEIPTKYCFVRGKKTWWFALLWFDVSAISSLNSATTQTVLQKLHGQSKFKAFKLRFVGRPPNLRAEKERSQRTNPYIFTAQWRKETQCLQKHCFLGRDTMTVLGLYASCVLTTNSIQLSCTAQRQKQRCCVLGILAQDLWAAAEAEQSASVFLVPWEKKSDLYWLLHWSFDQDSLHWSLLIDYWGANSVEISVSAFMSSHFSCYGNWYIGHLTLEGLFFSDALHLYFASRELQSSES